MSNGPDRHARVRLGTDSGSGAGIETVYAELRVRSRITAANRAWRWRPFASQ